MIRRWLLTQWLVLGARAPGTRLPDWLRWKLWPEPVASVWLTWALGVMLLGMALMLLSPIAGAVVWLLGLGLLWKWERERGR